MRCSSLLPAPALAIAAAVTVAVAGLRAIRLAEAVWDVSERKKNVAYIRALDRSRYGVRFLLSLWLFFLFKLARFARP